MPVIGCCNSPPNLVVINQHMPWGSLYTLLHEGTGVVVDTAAALRLAVDVARGMAFLHSLERIIPQYHLNSRHVMVSCEFFLCGLLPFNQFCYRGVIDDDDDENIIYLIIMPHPFFID